MNSTLQKTWSVLAATVALSTGMMAASGSAHAFLITKTSGTSPASSVNPSLSPPTVINFNGLTGNVPAALTSIGPGSTNNGGAKIQETGSGTANYSDNQLNISRNGLVTLVFDDARGMGYLGFNWIGLGNNETLSFFSGNALIQSFTGQQIEDLVGNVKDSNYLNFFVTKNSEIFNKITLTKSSAGSFQIDNLAYQAIPTPALLPGLLAMGVGMFRKRKAQDGVEAEA